jgi:hypothetical protein
MSVYIHNHNTYTNASSTKSYQTFSGILPLCDIQFILDCVVQTYE